MTRIAALVLAAGESRRMGRPKALVSWGGQALVTHAIEQAGGLSPLVVVEGAHALPPDCLAGAQSVHNPNWRAGQLASVQAGLRAVLPTPGLTGVLVLTIDRPHVRPETIAALVDAFAADPRSIWQPEHQGRHGHPILYPVEVGEALLALDPASQSARTLLAQPDLTQRRRFVSVDDPAVLDNIDSPRDLDKLPGWVES